MMSCSASYRRSGGSQKSFLEETDDLLDATGDGWEEFWSDSSNITEAVADTPDAAANSSDDPWLNFPPLDEGALRAIYGPPIDLDELFSENPRKIRKFKRDSGRRADEACEEERKRENDSENLKPNCVQDSSSGKRKREDAVDQSAEPHNTLTKKGKTVNASSKTSGKDLKKCAEMMKKDDCELADEPSTVEKMTRQQCPTDDLLIEAKLEASRVRIREGYNRAKDEKQQRRIQLLDLHDIPKPVDSMKSCKSMARRDRGFTNRWRR